jgi:DNA-binding transcriptional LysR family regulator
MGDWENLRHLAALARGGSLSAAARLLGTEHATISRRVAALEGETGLKLVDRRGHRVSLTADGVRIAAIAERMEGESLAVERLAVAARSTLTGAVTISAPPALAAVVLVKALARLQKRHPGLALRLVGEHRQAALDRREADIAVRFRRPEDGDLALVKIGEVPFHFYASPAYLASTSPEAWVFIAYDDAMSTAPQHHRLREFAGDRPVVLTGSTSEIQQAAAREGLGVAILPDFLAETDAGLVVIPEDRLPLTREVWLVVHGDLREVPAVRAVMTCLKEAMGPTR